MFFARKVVQIAQQEPQRVAYLAIRLPRRFEIRQVDLDVVFERERADPPSANIRAEMLEQLIDIERVALGLAHLPAVLVDHEAMREQRLERRASRRAQRRQQRRLKPSAMLI